MSAPLDFLRLFAGRLRGAGIRFAITSGMACVHYGLQQTTKDSDWIVAPADIDRLRDLLIGLEHESPAWRVSYRPIFAAPLESVYLGNGWTSHFSLRDAEGVEQKVDFFGKPPRVPKVETEPNDPDYATRHVVALMKRTDRDRDWPIVFGCGVQMLQHDDLRGVLHLQEPDWLKTGWARIPSEAKPELERLRPLLRLADAGPERLRRLLSVERALWEAVNRTRYQPFERAWKEFYRRWKLAPGAEWPLK